MRLSRLALLLVVALAAAPAATQQTQDDQAARALAPFAVNIDRAHKQDWPGYGVYLGRGLVLTAAHVVGPAAHGAPIVLIAGKSLAATFVKEGAFETVDLTLLRIDAAALPAGLGLRLLPICRDASEPGQRVIVVTPQSTAFSHVVPPRLLPAGIRDRFGTAIGDVATTGNSGSGVFDPQRRCLMGVISRKIRAVPNRGAGPAPAGGPIDLAKYFVPAAEIRAFIDLD